MNLFTYADRDMLMLDLANLLAEELAEALHHNDRVSFAVPGGTTPAPVYDVLSALDLDWARIDVLLTDERWVPETSPRSNSRMIRQRLLQGRAGAACFVPLYLDAPRPEDVLDKLSASVAPVLPIDVLLLGMGADMHTASLFPGADRLAEALSHDAPILLPMRAPGADEPRITLTAPVLQGALATHLLVTGEEKRAALDEALRLDRPTLAPVATILNDVKVHWAE